MQLADVSTGVRSASRFPSPLSAKSPTLFRIENRGILAAGVSIDVRGLSWVDGATASDFDVDFARALSAILFGDQRSCRLVSTSPSERFSSLHQARIDIGLCNAPKTLRRELENEIVFPVVRLVDREATLVQAKDAGCEITTWPDLRAAVQRGTTTPANLERPRPWMETDLHEAETLDAAIDLLRENSVDDVIFDGIGLAGALSERTDRDAFAILPEPLSREMMGPYISLDDPIFPGSWPGPFSPWWRSSKDASLNCRRGRTIRTARGGPKPSVTLRATTTPCFDRNLGTGSPLGLAAGVKAPPTAVETLLRQPSRRHSNPWRRGFRPVIRHAPLLKTEDT